MINRLVIMIKRMGQAGRGQYTFATDFSDPYYILGVDKNADIAEVKKAFYKLANQNHPDKTEGSQQASSKFLLIKQAYEAIKLQKGLTKPSGFVYEADLRSMRPDPSRFQADDEENRKSQADFKMHQQKAEAAGEEYDQFKGTFKTVDDINDIKIRVEKGEMKDSTKRFDLDSAKANIKSISGSGVSLYLIIGVAAAVYLMAQLKSHNRRSARQLKTSIEAQDAEQSKRRIFDEEESKRQKYMQTINNSKQVNKFVKHAGKLSHKKKQEIQSGENSA